MQFRLIGTALLVIVAFVISGCDNHDKTDTTSKPTTLTIQHTQGSTQIPLHPQKVIVLNPATLDIMDALKIPVIGVPQTDAHFPPFLMQYQNQQYLNAGTLFEPNYEAISAAKPDLIIAGNRAHDAYDKLSEIAPTISLDIDYSHFLASLTQRTELLGKIFDKQAQAKQLLSDFDQQMAAIKAQTKQIGSAMVLMVTGGKISAFGPGSRFGFIFDDLGFPSAVSFDKTGPHGNIVNAELILKANPHWLFVVDRDIAVYIIN